MSRKVRTKLSDIPRAWKVRSFGELRGSSDNENATILVIRLLRGLYVLLAMFRDAEIGKAYSLVVELQGFRAGKGPVSTQVHKEIANGQFLEDSAGKRVVDIDPSMGSINAEK